MSGARTISEILDDTARQANGAEIRAFCKRRAHLMAFSRRVDILRGGLDRPAHDDGRHCGRRRRACVALPTDGWGARKSSALELLGTPRVNVNGIHRK